MAIGSLVSGILYLIINVKAPYCGAFIDVQLV